LNGLTLAGLYFIVASGFTLIFGLMRVVNMAHGSLYLLGGYIGLRLVEHRVNYWLALVLAALAIGVVGLLMQQLFLRWNQGQDLRQALITIAISVLLADQMIPTFGAAAVAIKAPDGLSGALRFGLYDIRYPTFRLVVLGLAVLIGVSLPAGYTNFSILLTFALLVFVLAVRPTGLFGRR